MAGVYRTAVSDDFATVHTSIRKSIWRYMKMAAFSALLAL